MPGWAKALIIIAVLGVLLVVGVIAAGAFWWSRYNDPLLAMAAEGQQAGRKTDNQGCVDQSILRYKADPGFNSTIWTKIFVLGCLQTSRTTPGFCDGIPKVSEIKKSTEWRMAQCERVGLSSDQYCPQLFGPVQGFCEQP